MVPRDDELCRLSIVGQGQGGNYLPPRRLEEMALALTIATPHTQIISFLYSASSFTAILQVRNLSLRGGCDSDSLNHSWDQDLHLYIPECSRKEEGWPVRSKV